MNKDSKIFVAGHKGLVGSALTKKLLQTGHTNLITRTHSELELRDKGGVEAFFAKEKPEYIFLAAARVGGIMANQSSPADFIYDNLEVQNNVISAAQKYKAKKLLFLGSSCIYPKLAPQPIEESSFLSGKLEPTNEAYAIAKIAGIVLCQSYNKQYGTRFISAMPTNLYGTGDNFDLQTSHVLPALIRKFHDAKKINADKVVLWGTGNAMREFMHVDDAADALIFLMNNYEDSDIINVGTGEDTTIRELAEKIKKISGFGGLISYDGTKPDGTPRKLLNAQKLHSLGWKHKIALEDGIKDTYNWYKENSTKTT